MGNSLQCDNNSDLTDRWSPVAGVLGGHVTVAELAGGVVRRFVGEARKGRLRLRLPTEVQPRARDYSRRGSPKLFLQLVGVNVFRFPDGSMRVAPGELCVIPASYPHRERREFQNGRYAHMFVSAEPGAVYYHLHAPESKADRFPGNRSERRVTSLGERMLSLLGAIAAAAGSFGASGGQAIRDGLLLALLGTFESVLTDPVPLPAPNALITRCKQIVERDLTSPDLTVAAVATELGVHPDYLSRLFSGAERMRLSRYINENRIQRAKELLTGTNAQIGEIADSTGFSDRAYFAKVFRTFGGCSPTVYRRHAPGAVDGVVHV